MFWIIETYVPEFEELERCGYFSHSELKDILLERTKFEYALKRKMLLKIDYLRSLEFEVKLEKLRELRAKNKALINIVKNRLSNFCISRRIHLLFKRATVKLPFETRFWLMWLDYCRSTKARKQMSRAITRVLRLQSSSAGIWLYASFWELEEQRNIHAFRSLIQCGLRECKNSNYLWINLLRFEIMQTTIEFNKKETSYFKKNFESYRITDKTEENLNFYANKIISEIIKSAFNTNPFNIMLRIRCAKVLTTFDDVLIRSLLENNVHISILIHFPNKLETIEATSRKYLTEKFLSISGAQFGRTLNEYILASQSTASSKISEILDSYSFKIGSLKTT